MVSGVPLLVSVQGKIDRANEHLKALEKDFVDVGKRNSMQLIGERNPDMTQAIFKIRFDPPPGIVWGGIIGDYAHNLRSALNHLLFAISVGESGLATPPDADSIQFPIVDSPDDWPKIKWRVKARTTAVINAVKAEQPYEGGNRRYLSLLRDIDNGDEHRTTLAVPYFAAVQSFKLPDWPAFQEVRAFPGAIVDEAIIAMFRWDTPKPNLNPNVDLKLSFQVTINVNGQWRQALPQLVGIRDEVVRLVDLLRPFVK